LPLSDASSRLPPPAFGSVQFGAALPMWACCGGASVAALLAAFDAEFDALPQAARNAIASTAAP
jgi:hypothetical protein